MSNENCLLSRFNRYFETSDLQCGFKAKAGCSEALSLLCSTVQYFTNNGSTVSIASLDMSKAFDKVNHYALFLKLYVSLICMLTGTRMCLSL